MIRVVPGCIKDISTIKASITEFGLSNVTLILDRDLFSDENIKKLLIISWMLWLQLCVIVSFMIMFLRCLWITSFIRIGLLSVVRCVVMRWVVLHFFVDPLLCGEEEMTLYRLLDEKKLDRQEFLVRLGRVGKILVVSSLDVGCGVVFELYKSRGEVEQHFDTFKNTLRGICCIWGMMKRCLGICLLGFCRFMGIVCCRIFFGVRGCLIVFRLWIYLKSFRYCMVDDGINMVLSEVPKKARVLNEKLGLNLFPKTT
jgi:hypothetical protein